MDTLSLKKYNRQSFLVDKDTVPLKQQSKSKRLPAKSEKEFLEFCINDKPLSELLDELYGTKESTLDNWIGVLGSSENHKAEIMKVKQLTRKSISDNEIRQAYPSEWSESEFQWYLEKTKEELSDPEVIIYCCAECGDYDCGGIKAKIVKTENTFMWIITEKNKQLTFEFDKYQYFDVFDKYIRQLEKKAN